MSQAQATISVLRLEKGEDATDAELVVRALERDRQAEEALFRRHAKDVADVAARLLQSRADAEDVVQETFVIALTRLDRLRDPARVRQWIVRIAVRQVYRRLRKRKLLRALGLDRGTDDATLVAMAAPDLDPERRAELALLDVQLARIPPKERVPWILHHVEGATLPEVADACDCSLATAKRRIAAAQARILRRTKKEVS